MAASTSSAWSAADVKSAEGSEGCPFLGLWNGSDYAFENSLLPIAEYSNMTDANDYYMLQSGLVPCDNETYSLQVSELSTEDFFDRVGLRAVDHPANVSVGVSPYGEILTYAEPFAPVKAWNNYGVDVTALVGSADGNSYEGLNESYITVEFGALNVTNGSTLVVKTKAMRTSPVRVQVQDEVANWTDVSVFFPRHDWSTDVLNMSAFLSAEENATVRLCFGGNVTIDYVSLDAGPQATVDVHEGTLVSAMRTCGPEPLSYPNWTVRGAVYNDLQASDDFRAKLTPGELFELNFTVADCTGEARDFVFVAEGYYKEAGDPAFCVFPDWENWFGILEANMREHGWIWANVAGYSCHYFGNSWYYSLFPGYSHLNDRKACSPKNKDYKKCWTEPT
jgi:hypothetical protein